MNNEELDKLNVALELRTDDPDEVFKKIENAVVSGDFDKENGPPLLPTQNTVTNKSSVESQPLEDTVPPEPTAQETKEVPPETTKTSKVSPDEPIVIDDNFITLQKDPEIQAILKEIKGEQLTPKMLKMVVNEQSYIRKMKEDSQKRSLDANLPSNPSQTSVPSIADPQVIESLTFTNIKSRHPEIPASNVKEFHEYLTNVQFEDKLKADRLSREFDRTEEQVNQQLQQYAQMRATWEDTALNIVKEDLQRFENELSEMGLTPKDLGLDLKLSPSATGREDYNEYLYKNVLFSDPDKQIPNPNVIGFVLNVPVVHKNSVYETLMRKNLPSILAKVREGKVVPGNRPAVSARTKPTPPPTLASARGGNFTPQPSKEKDLENIIDNPNSSMKDIDGALDTIVSEWSKVLR